MDLLRPERFFHLQPIVGHGVIGNNDIVLVDANCHKSICHSLTVTSARPVYFKPTRNGYGMIGLVPLRRFCPEHIQQLIKDSPFSAVASSQEPSYAVVTNSTYDGFCYDVQRVTSMLARSVPCIHFDEAVAYAKFHSIIADDSPWMCRKTCPTGRCFSPFSRPTRCWRPSPWHR